MSRNDEVVDMGSESDSSSSDDTPMESIEMVDGVPMDTTGGPAIHDAHLELWAAKLWEMKNKFVKVAKRLLPHFALFTVCFLYLIIGATILHAIESPNELIQREKEMGAISRLKNEFREHMRNITQDENNKVTNEAFNVIYEEHFTQLARAIMKNQHLNEKHLLNEANDDELQWTFANSVFFATTMLTTIGYGNLIPATTLGRIACLFIALFGIPLMHVTIADMGRFLSEFLKSLYLSYLTLKKKIIRRDDSPKEETWCYPVSSPLETAWHIILSMPLLAFLAYTAIGGILFKFLEDQQYLDAFYSSFMRITTVGFGNIVPTDQMSIFVTITYIIFGVTLSTLWIDFAGTQYISTHHYQCWKMGRAITQFFSRVKHVVYPQE